MLLKVGVANRIGERVALRAMFEARKRVFVDLLKWEIPALDGRFEVDRFDDSHAVYIILTDGNLRHLGSARLLPTTRPGILGSLYPHLCDGPVPQGDRILEITRFCLSPDMRAATRRMVRNKLVTALAMYALDHGIDAYTGVAEAGWFEQISRFGWDCRTVGSTNHRDRAALVALWIDIDVDTLAKLATAGTYADPDEALPRAA